MADLVDLRGSVREELGVFDDASSITDAMIDRYLAEGVSALEPDVLDYNVTTITWTLGDDSLALPADYRQLVRITYPESGTTRVPSYTEHGRTWYFDCEATQNSSGTIRVLYRASFADLVDGTDTELPVAGRGAIIAYACYRILKRIVADRDSYKKYSTLSNGQTAEPQDLERLAQTHYDDYLELKEVARLATAGGFAGM